MGGFFMAFGLRAVLRRSASRNSSLFAVSSSTIAAMTVTTAKASSEP